MRAFLYLNCFLLLTSILLSLFFAGFILTPKDQVVLPISSKPYEYKHISRKWTGVPVALAASLLTPLKLESSPYVLTLPDMRDEILFYGKNMRPDLKEGKTLFLVGLEGQEALTTIEEGAPLYLRYQPSVLTSQEPLWGENSYEQQEGTYCFSSNNQPTALWIELTKVTHESRVYVQLFLIDEQGEAVSGAAERASFLLEAKNVKPSTQWELDKYRVDPTLLVRQRARFTGEDLFLQMHGGSEYASIAGHYRIDFLDPTPYSCFIQEGDCLLWEEKRWKVVDNKIRTANKPLLIVKKVDDRIMHFELWNELGSQKIALSLVRLREHHSLPNLATEFHFVQAKTWTQFIVECHGKKMTLRPNDWLLLTEEGWQLIDTVEKIDDYVAQTLQGPLFIVGKLKKEGGEQILTGHLFNTTRSEVTEVTLKQKNSPPELSLVETERVQPELYYED